MSDRPIYLTTDSSLTQCVNSEFFGLDLFGLVSRSYLGLETIRNQTLPEAITLVSRA
jgi:hypothetical protein